MKWRPESYSRSWNGRQHEYYPLKGLREKTNEYLETISELEDKISNDTYRVSFPKSLLKNFESRYCRIRRKDLEQIEQPHLSFYTPIDNAPVKIATFSIMQ